MVTVNKSDALSFAEYLYELPVGTTLRPYDIKCALLLDLAGPLELTYEKGMETAIEAGWLEPNPNDFTYKRIGPKRTPLGWRMAEVLAQDIKCKLDGRK